MALVGWESGDGFCRSELAREKLSDTSVLPEKRVTVDDFREQARSYKDGMWVRKTAPVAVASTDSSAVANSTGCGFAAVAHG
ncbi:hypothetical protein D3C85_1673920 [compost metagenome]